MTTPQPLCPQCGSDRWQIHQVATSGPNTYRVCYRCQEKYCRAKWYEAGDVRNMAEAHLVAGSHAARMVNAQTVRNEV